jgi:hypothetical protein
MGDRARGLDRISLKLDAAARYGVADTKLKIGQLRIE